MTNERTSDSHALEVLEFPDFLQMLTDYAFTERAKQWIRGLKPLATRAEIGAQHDLIRNLFQKIETEGTFPQPDFEIRNDILQRTRPKEAALPGEDLLEVQRHLAAVAETKKNLAQSTLADLECLRLYQETLDDCRSFRNELTESIDKHGELCDEASTRLASIRENIYQLSATMHARLEYVLQDSDLSDVFQDHFITLRKDRYVLPVKREMKNRIRGVVHDHSDSGQTVFIEPHQVMHEGNDLAEYREEERNECRRILKRLTNHLREHLDQIITNLELMTELDAGTAIVKWAHEYQCVFPVFSSRYRLFQARHPLLDRQFRLYSTQDLVPLDLDLEDDPRAIAITGSNSGGKTVVLKTIGLLTLIANAGLPVPAAPDSEIKMVDHVFADIGDEQSISENLSTFTGHMRNIANILTSVNTGGTPLVLLDELGSGTDPLEGGALACSIIGELIQTHAVTFATTHLGAVKTYVHEQPGMINAAMRFNPETLNPEYVLELGHPGASHALAIAERTGLPSSVMERAKALLDSDHMRLETVIAELEEQKRQATQQEAVTKEEVAKLQDNRDKLRNEVDDLHQQRERLLHDAYQEAAQTVTNTRKEMDRLLKQLKESVPEDAAPSRSDTPEVIQRAAEEQKDELQKAAAVTHPRPQNPVDKDHLEPGQLVWVEKLRDHAAVVETDMKKERVTVSCGAVSFAVSIKELGKPDPSKEKTERQTHSAKLRKPRGKGNATAEINLHGYTVDDAMTAVDKLLNRAALDGLHSVRLIHGHGSGRLKTGLHDYLKHHDLVADHRLGEPGHDRGGAAVTVVTLSSSFR